MVDEMRKVLIVDDEERIRDMYVRALVEEGFLVRKAADAGLATNILIREEMDIVLLDIKMPEINGQIMFDVIREYDPTLKIIVCSVYHLETQRIMIPGADGYHNKTHGISILIEKINGVLNKQMIPAIDFLQSHPL